MAKVSVIMAVYNAEGTIRRGIDSVLKQNFTDYELLLVDDGSTDHSGQICDEYGCKDCRVRVFHKENEGIAATRQYGIDRAQGEYMIHVDPDDWIEENTLQLMVEAAVRDNAQVVVCDYNLITKSEKIYKPQIINGNTPNSLIDGILAGVLLGGGVQ